MINKKYILLLVVVSLLVPCFSRKACSAVTVNEIGRACVKVLKEEDNEYFLQKIVPIQDDDGRKELILLGASLAGSGNTSLVALLRHQRGCEIVLNTTGRGIDAEPLKNKGFPKIFTYYSNDRDEATGEIQTEDVAYFWNGKEYEDATLSKRMAKGKSLNKKALELFRRQKIEEAIRVWERIAKDSDAVSAEILTNLGFAYYTLGKKTGNTSRFSYDPFDPKPIEHTPYDKAYDYLRDALEKEPTRWSALLNMGDLAYETNEFLWAIRRYEKLLQAKPGYKHRDLILKRLDELKRKPEKVGEEVVVLRYRSGEKDIAYTRMDAKKVVRCGYYADGKLRFRETIVDGHEDGEYKSWFDDGVVSVEGQMLNGKEIGKYIYRAADGSISQVLIFKEDGTSVDVTNGAAGGRP